MARTPFLHSKTPAVALMQKMPNCIVVQESETVIKISG